MHMTARKVLTRIAQPTKRVSSYSIYRIPYPASADLRGSALGDLVPSSTPKRANSSQDFFRALHKCSRNLPDTVGMLVTRMTHPQATP
jgi:hypothetical protein